MPLNRPTCSELQEAIDNYRRHPSENLQADRFYQRVMANMEAIIAREAKLGEAYQAREEAALQASLATVNTECQGEGQGDAPLTDINKRLCQYIEAGEFDAPAKAKALVARLRPLSEAKLAIDNPRYVR